MTKLHLDTDLGGDIDDLCALAMLLRWPGVELTGITTVGDHEGRRAGYVRYVTSLAGRGDIPIAAGADTAQGYFRYPELGLPDEAQYWPEPISPFPGDLADALALLKKSIEEDAIIIGIGPYTNLRLLDERYPGILGKANIILMGGYVHPVRAGFPQWGNDMDWNIQVDIRSAKHVLTHANPLLVPLTVTVETSLRRAYLEPLRNAGPLGNLIARQMLPFAEEHKNEERFGKICARLPDDTINFQHDPLACAIALGWCEGVTIEEIPLAIEERDGYLFERIDPSGKRFQVVTKIDGSRFNEFWLKTIIGESE